MAIATCWKCGAQVLGPTCQRCGAAQQSNAMQGQPYAGPAGQPVVGQASISVRSPQPTANGYAAGGQYPYPQPAQPGAWQNPPSAPGQGGWQTPQPAPGQGNWQGYPQQAPGYPQPGYQGPSAYQQQQAAMGARPAAPAAKQQAALNPVALLLGVAGGVVGGLVGAVIWAAILNLTNYNVYYLAIAIGILAGAGVSLGARGQNRILLAIIAAVLGLLTFFIGLFLRVSYWEGFGFTSLPIGDFTRAMSDYLQTNPINYVFFLAVPVVAALAAFNNTLTRRRLRR